MESKENKTAGRVVYTLLTFTAVVILFVTLYTFFGAANRDEKHKTAPDTSGDMTTDYLLPPENVTPGINVPVGDKDGEYNPPHSPEDTADGEEAPVPSETEKSNVDVSSKPEGDTDTGNVPLGDRKLTSPVKGVVAKGHDAEKAVFSVTMNDYRVHCGIDIDGNLGDSVVACGKGIITGVESDPFMGTCVTLDLGGNLTAKYCGLDPTLPDGIVIGASVAEGQPIGNIGESAIIEIGDSPHLHFEMLYDGNYIDPLSVLKHEPAESVKNYED